MAGFTRTSGDFQQVLNVDAGSYTAGAINAIDTGVTVNAQGPKLQFATITFTGSSTTGAQILAAINVIQQNATIAIYEWTTDTNDTLAVAFFPVDAWGTDVTATGDGTLDAELTSAVGEAVTITATASFTN